MAIKTIKYPVILTEYLDEDGHYFVVTSPNLNGLVAEGYTIPKALDDAVDVAELLLEDEENPKVQDPRLWKLEHNQVIQWIKVKVTD